jgi:antirestriction protein ArdC
MRDNVSQYVIKPLLAALETGNLPFWTKPWKTRDGMPLNGATGKNYRGGNRVMLMIANMISGQDDPRYLGMSQGNKIGLKVKAGSKGTMIWIPMFAKDKETKDEKLVGFKYGHVFHASQFEGDKAKMIPLELRELPNNPIPACDEWINRLGPKMMTGVAASYCRQTDTICMPPLSSFDSAQKYYKTLLHELGHWTGSKERLDREKGKFFGDEKYGYEELVAEIFSLLASYELGLEVETEIKDTAAYCKHWYGKLSENPNWIPMAAEAAEKALRFCLKGKIEIEAERHEEVA